MHRDERVGRSGADGTGVYSEILLMPKYSQKSVTTLFRKQKMA